MSNLDYHVVGDASESHNEYNLKHLYRNFVIMSVCFSSNHGCVVACLAYASAEFGDNLGGYGSGILYICYALVSFLVAKPVVSMVGPKNGLLIGLGGYCLYVAGFLLALMTSNVEWRWIFFIIACVCGGSSGGFLWTAQGRYFARNAKVYAECYHVVCPEYIPSSEAESTEYGHQANRTSDIDDGTNSLLSNDIQHIDSNLPRNNKNGMQLKSLEQVYKQVNSTFAGIFATCYLGLEVITKVIATVVFVANEDNAPFIIFTIYSAIALLAFVTLYTLDSLGEDGTWKFDTDTMVINSLSAGRMMVTDAKLTLLLPFQLAFGFVASYMQYYVFGTVVADSDQLGGTYIGLLSAIIACTGALTAIPAGALANKYGKSVLMVTGGMCFTLAGFTFLVVSNDDLGTWAYIVPYLIIFGIGRGTWVGYLIECII